ncbi:MAG: hypothetical protein DDT18_00366 [Actinobacteria bacterium]|nr:hypothetical protein [Actinomycetota bacterium]
MKTWPCEHSPARTAATQVGKIYISEATGCVAGGILFTYLLVHHLQPFEIAAGAGLLNLIAAILLLKPWAVAWRTGKDVALEFLVSSMVIVALALGIYSVASGRSRPTSVRGVWGLQAELL